MIVEFTGKERWRRWGFHTPEFGHASIDIDGLPAGEGRITGGGGSFVISDAGQRPLLTSTLVNEGRWKAFLGLGQYVLYRAAGDEVARIVFGGPFGLRRSALLIGQKFTFSSWQTRLELPGATISTQRRRRLRVHIFHEAHHLAYLGLAFHHWLFLDRSSFC